MEKVNVNTEITGDILHELASTYNVTLREINKVVGNRVYAIVCDCSKYFSEGEEVQMDLFDK